MSTRYTEAVRPIAERLAIQESGLGIVVTTATQQDLVAGALASLWPAATHDVLAPETVGLPAPALIATLPADASRAQEALVALNGARQRLAAAGRLMVLIVSRTELQAVQRHAGASYSTARFVEVCPFVPDPAVDHDQARETLRSWIERRVGRLDLRGFIRAHTEDVSWTVEDIYQELRGRERPSGDRGPRFPIEQEEHAPLMVALARGLTRERATLFPHLTPGMAVILGHPGTGKTFFLRWLALRAASADALLQAQAPLPVLISLAAFARAPRPQGLCDYMVETLLQEGQPAAHVLARAMEQGRVLFLLDGLDEAGDEAGRRQVARAVRELAERASGCPIVATSRISGYTDAPLPGHHIEILPLAREAIERFLITWCRLYACELHGAHAAQRGEDEGRRLARDVLASPELEALARNPLLLTVLAIVHRTGVRLPDHRVELYSHATQVLVERWNQVRSLSGTGSRAPIKLADAVRLLGPVALDMVRAGAGGALSEEALVHSLERSLAARPLRSIASAREALALFQRSLGLLVEQGPGMYGFLHLTLAEYFAAWELVRSGQLEELVREPRDAFLPRWREVVLLAAGELGVNRADDVRLDQLVDALVTSASRRRGRPSPTVPSLLAGLLADDPGLSVPAARDIVECLIPTWWFERKYDELVWFFVRGDMGELVVDRISRGRFAPLMRERLRAYFARGLDDAAFDKLGGLLWTPFVRTIAWSLDVDDSPLFFLALRKKRRQVIEERWQWSLLYHPARDALWMGRELFEACRRRALRLTIHGVFVEADQERVTLVPLHVDLDAAMLASGDTPCVDVPFTVEPSAEESDQAGLSRGQFAGAYIHDWELEEEPTSSRA